MYELELDFVSNWECPHGWLLDATGAYIMWPLKICAVPSYIGEGLLNHRISSHSKNVGEDIAVLARTDLGERGSKVAKHDAGLLEGVLLMLFELIGRPPKRNIASRKTTSLNKIIDGHGGVRLNITGVNPLAHPLKRGAELKGRHNVMVRTDGELYLIKSSLRKP